MEEADTKLGLWHALPLGKRAITVVGNTTLLAFEGLLSHYLRKGPQKDVAEVEILDADRVPRPLVSGLSNSATHGETKHVQGRTSPDSVLTFHNFQISNGKAWYPMKFMVDSGATSSPGASYDRWFSHTPLHHLDKKVYAMDDRLVKDIRGFFQTKINFGARVHLDRFYLDRR